MTGSNGRNDDRGMGPRYSTYKRPGLSANSSARGVESSAMSGPFQDDAPVVEGVQPAGDRPTSRWEAAVWVTGVALVLAGIALHFFGWTVQHGTQFTQDVEDGTLITADGTPLGYVIFGFLAVTVAPQLIVVGVVTLVANVFRNAIQEGARRGWEQGNGS